MIYCKDCSTTDCPYQKEKEERENDQFKKILGCNKGVTIILAEEG